MLVDTSLVAVVSLPAGVFNPYSGVKTSILILDKRVHKQTDKVLFVKVQNDGFNLGAQRRAVVDSHLPEATRLLRSWMTAPDKFVDGVMAQAVERAQIGASGDFNLSGERYVVGTVATSSYDFVELGDVVDILDSRRRPITKGDRVTGPYPYYGATGVLDYVHEFLFDESLVLIGEDGAKWESGDKTAFAVSGKIWVNNHAHVVRPQRDKLLDVYLVEMLRQMDLSPHITGVTVPKLNQEKLRSIQIPLPPLEVQHQIVVEIEGYQKIIDGARQVLDNYKPHIVVSPDWPDVHVGDVASIRSGGTPDRSNDAYWGGTIPWIKTGQIDFGVIEGAEEFITPAGMENSAARMFPAGTILMAMYGQGITRGRVAILGIDATTNQACAAIEVTSASADRDFLYWSLAGKYQELRAISESRGGNQSNLNSQLIREVKIPLPDLETQRAIVAEIEAEQALVAANRELIRRMEVKVKSAIDRVWGESAKPA
jgi:type I restriction enzyme M protein